MSWSLLAHCQMPMPSVQCLTAASIVSHCGARMLARDHDIDIMAAAQTMIHHRQQTVGIGRQIDADDLGFFVHDVINETGILMREAVVILPPDMRGQQVIQRGDFPPPRQMRRDLQPLGVLVEHRIHDMNERLVAIEKSMPSGKQITFEPAFALMFAQHLHHASGGRKKFVVRHGRGVPLPVGGFKDGFQTDWRAFHPGRKCENFVAS